MDINNSAFTHHHASSPLRKLKWTLILILGIILLALAGWFLAGSRIKDHFAATSNGYQAVFLSNGQVYFGKISFGEEWVKLTDIYYLQATQNLQQASTDQSKTTATPANSNIQLVKLGSELHGPQDEMYIEKDKVMFWENMKDDSKVIEAIRKYQVK